MDDMEEWLSTRPESIRAAVAKRPPDRLYRLREHIVYIMSYVEPDMGPEACAHCRMDGWPKHLHQGSPTEATVSVGVTERYNPDLLFERRVFGIRLDDLEFLPKETEDLFKQAGSADLN